MYIYIHAYIYIYIYVYLYICMYILNSIQYRMGKTLVNTTNFPTSFGRCRSQHENNMISKINVILFNVT